MPYMHCHSFPCMGWRTQGGQGRNKDPWVRTTLSEGKGAISHLDKEDQQELWPCLKSDLTPILWMNTWHSPHFNFPIPPINYSHSVNHLCAHTYIINPCLYQPTSVLYCAPSPHSADKGPWTETSCIVVAKNFYAMLSKKDLWNTVYNITGWEGVGAFLQTSLAMLSNHFTHGSHHSFEALVEDILYTRSGNWAQHSFNYILLD